MPIGNSNYEILDDDRLLGESVFYRDNQLVTGNGSPVSGGGGSVTVENVLTSSSTANALSAAMGKNLKDTADALATTVSEKADAAATTSALAGKQATLVSGTNIKTINNQAVLGSGDLSVALNTTTTLEHLPSTTAWAATLTPASYVSRFGFSSNVAIVVTVAGVTSPAANIQIQYSNDAGVSVASGPTTIGTISANGTQTINLNPLTMPGAMFKVLINSGTGTGGTAGINVTMS